MTTTDVVRVLYPDLVGIDRSRDVLAGELESGHGLAFCRAVYHTTPRGDVVEVPGGLDAGLPDITIHPDRDTLRPLPWEPGVAWCLGDAREADGSPCPEDPRNLVRRAADRFASLDLAPAVGPELEYFLLVPEGSGWARYADAPGLLAAAYLGIRDQLEPPAPLQGYGYDPARASLLPQRLPDALDALASDNALGDVLGKGFVDAFLAYKRNEVARFERHVTDWEFGEYAYHL